MTKRKFIVLGDTTTHSGTVVTAWGRDGPTPMTIDGKPVACVGDKVTCPRCKGVHTIVGGARSPNTTLHEREIAREGDPVSDGSKLISAGQSSATHDNEYGAYATAGAASAAAAAMANVTPPPASQGILSASAGGGITAEEARLLKEQQDKKGYVTVFINSNGIGIFKDGHAAIFVGRGSDADRILFDPCGYYAKGKGFANENPEHRIVDRTSPIFKGEQFSYRDYYLYHRTDGSNLNAYSFEITKDEENQIRARIERDAQECWGQCTLFVSSVLNGIGPFKGLDSVFNRIPAQMGKSLKSLTKLPITMGENNVINRMRGKNQ